MTVAALFVETGGSYFGLKGVDPWDEQRDARKYPGPHSVVAHPPCNRWSMPLAKVNQTRYGHKIGDDDGCFASALDSVTRWGGVLEHPANTAAWRAFDIVQPKPGGWLMDHGWGRRPQGWVCRVAQSAYGHKAQKRTWLYYVGPIPPELDWSEPPATAVVSYLTAATALPRITKQEASATPVAFRDLLLTLARQC